MASTPILLVVTSDAVLRMYAFGHFQHQQPLSHPPLPVPSAAPAWLQLPKGACARVRVPIDVCA